MACSSRVDGYGFTRASDFDHEAYEEFMSSYLPILAKRASRWKSYLGNSTKVSTSFVVKRMCRKGIPAEQRSMVWMCISGAAKLQKHAPSLYEDLLAEPKDPEMMEIISKDVPRSFTGNIFFTVADDPYGMHKPLTNVLGALSHKSPSIPYISGMNYITGLLLLMLKDEEKVFWLCDTLFTQILPDFYALDMNALNAELELLGEIIRWKLPVIFNHMETLGVPWDLIVMKWFICLYADVLPTETVYRIWDCLFYEGSKVLLRVALTIIDINKEKILACKHFMHVVELFKTVPIQPEILFCHSFMKQIFKRPGSFPRARITRLRADSVQKVAS